MSYRRIITGYFIVFSVALALLFGQLVIGALFIFQDRFHEYLLYKQAEMMESHIVDGRFADESFVSAAITIEEFMPHQSIPARLSSLESGITEINDTHILRTQWSNGNIVFLTMPELRKTIDELLMLVYTWLTIACVFVSLLGALLAIFLARRLSTPIEQLAQDVQQASPPYSFISNSDRSTEIQSLVQSFNGSMGLLVDAIDREKSFTQAVSHELRSPLTVIKSNLAILQESKSTVGVINTAVSRMQAASHSMEKLTETFLELARNEKWPGKKNTIKVHRIISSIVEAEGSKEIAWNIEGNAEVKLNTSEKLFEVLVRNIVSNANKYAEEGVVITTEDNSIQTTNKTSPEKKIAGSSELGLKIIERICNTLNWRMTTEKTDAEFRLMIEI